MKRLKYILLLLLIPLLIFPKVVISSAREGLDAWARNILPSLFPFAIISSIITALSSQGKTGRVLAKLSSIFKLPQSGIRSAFIGLISGYPIGAMTVSQAWHSKQIRNEDVALCAGIASVCSPMFLIATVGEGMLYNAGRGVMLLLMHYLAYALAVLLFCIGRKRQNCEIQSDEALPGKSLGTILKLSVDKASAAMISVCGYVVLFRVIMGIIGLLPIPETIEVIISVVLEMSVGCTLASRAVLPLAVRMALISFAVAWGGACVNLQINSYIAECNAKSAKCLCFKLAHGLIAGVISFAFWSACGG